MWWSCDVSCDLTTISSTGRTRPEVAVVQLYVTGTHPPDHAHYISLQLLNFVSRCVSVLFRPEKGIDTKWWDRLLPVIPPHHHYSSLRSPLSSCNNNTLALFPGSPSVCIWPLTQIFMGKAGEPGNEARDRPCYGNQCWEAGCSRDGWVQELWRSLQEASDLSITGDVVREVRHHTCQV